MKLIFIYGPPAVGKLTIAQKLSEKTGIPLFHNHLSRDIVKDIFPNTLSENYELVNTIRTDVFAYCARTDTDLIFTFVYEPVADAPLVKNYIKIVEENGGEVVFVELTADHEELIKRVDNESRTRYKKLLDPVVLKKFLGSFENVSIPFVSSLMVDTMQLDPESAANHIVNKLKLGN